MPTFEIACLGLNHRTAPLTLRERISCAWPGQGQSLHASLPQTADGLDEIVVLSTCNRIELYATYDKSVPDPYRLLVAYLGRLHATNVGNFREYLYFFRGRDAIDHLMHVAAGLDSLVLGEPQILGQVTEAFMGAVAAHTIGPVLTAVFRGVIRAGKRARSETNISSNPASISSVSVALAERIVGSLANHNVLVVGLGEMGHLTLNALRKRGVERISLANRSLERARELVQGLQGDAYPLDQLVPALMQADVVFTATAAPRPVIYAADVAAAMAERAGRKLVLVDIALPRDVAADAAAVPGVHLFNLDDLQATLDEALEARRAEIPEVEAIVDAEMTALEETLRTVAVRPVISSLRQKAEAIRQHEMERTLRFLGDDVDAETVEHIQHLSRSLVNKLLHEPTMRLREAASNGDGDTYAASVRDLFNLDSSLGGGL
jgi:glutamyl-tRNA reductase